MKELQKSYIRYGLLMTGLLVACLVVMELTGQNQSFANKSPLFLVYQFLAPAAVWYLGIKARKHANKNHLTYKQGFKEGFRIAMVFAVTSPFVFLVYYTLISPEIVAYVKQFYNMIDSPTEVVLGIEFSAQFLAALIFGTIYGAVISLFLKTKPK